MKERDINNAYRAIIWLLAGNNITGIALNIAPFLWSLYFIIGIPGAGLAVFYLIAAVKKKPKLKVWLPIMAIAYNILVYLILTDDALCKVIYGFEAGPIVRDIGVLPTVWPLINIALSITASGLASVQYLKLAKSDEK